MVRATNLLMTYLATIPRTPPSGLGNAVNLPPRTNKITFAGTSALASGETSCCPFLSCPQIRIESVAVQLEFRLLEENQLLGQWIPECWGSSHWISKIVQCWLFSRGQHCSFPMPGGLKRVHPSPPAFQPWQRDVHRCPAFGGDSDVCLLPPVGCIQHWNQQTLPFSL